MKQTFKVPELTRVEVIDETGRVFVSTGNENVWLSYQDDMRTLKVFLNTDEVLALTPGEGS